MLELSKQLNHRRETLGMPYRVLADRAGVGISTVQTALNGQGNVTMDILSAIADVLGCKMTLQPTHNINELLEQQATRKAQLLSAMTQGTSALEAQAVDAAAVAEAKRMTIHRLLAGSRRKLWT